MPQCGMRQPQKTKNYPMQSAGHFPYGNVKQISESGLQIGGAEKEGLELLFTADMADPCRCLLGKRKVLFLKPECDIDQ